MLIGHASDLHGSYKLLGKVETPDLWLITGDFFPNYGRGPDTGGLILPSYENHFQHRWWGFRADSIMDRLEGRPVLWMPGNHDFVSLAVLLRLAEYRGTVHDLTEGPFELDGQTFTGFREIPYIKGEWMGEVRDFSEIVPKAMSQDPTILVTHAPPGGILDYDPKWGHCGIPLLTTALTYQTHRIHHHFFGHVHPDGGKTQEEMGIKFVNSAQRIQLVEV